MIAAQYVEVGDVQGDIVAEATKVSEVCFDIEDGLDEMEIVILDASPPKKRQLPIGSKCHTVHGYDLL